MTVIIFVHRMASICNLTVSIVMPFSCTKIDFFKIASSPRSRRRFSYTPLSYAQITRSNFSDTILAVLSNRMVATAKWRKHYSTICRLAFGNGTNCLSSAEYGRIVREWFSVVLRGRRCFPPLPCSCAPNVSVFWCNSDSCCSRDSVTSKCNWKRNRNATDESEQTARRSGTLTSHAAECLCAADTWSNPFRPNGNRSATTASSR